MNEELVADALDTVRRTPAAAALWQRLCTLVRALPPARQPQQAARIAELPLAATEARWLQYSALAYLTRDARWLAAQAALVDEALPEDTAMTLLIRAWNHALVHAPERAAFMRSLDAIGLHRVQRTLAARLPAPASPAAPSVRQGLRRAAVYAPQINNSRHGGTMFALGAAGVLSRLGLEVRLFTAQEMMVPASAAYIGGAESLPPEPVQPGSLKTYAGGRFQIALPNPEFSLRLRMGKVAQALHAFAPDVVLFAGFMSPLATALAPHHPMIGLSVHAMPPMVPLDVWLAGEGQRDGPQWPQLPAPEAVDFPYRFWPLGHATPRARAQAGLPEDALVLTTAGFRLRADVEPAWRERVLALLQAHPRAHWVLIGVRGEQPIPGLPSHPRIHLFEPQPHLETWLAMSDIYLNPPRVGGGGTVAMAMEQGVPVAGLAGGDGGDKLGPLAAPDLDAYFAQAARWLADPAARREAGETLRRRYRDRLDLSGAAAQAGMRKACESALAAFAQRRNR
jgi:glycosyltransferase involved in cell wall biosynthesis